MSRFQCLKSLQHAVDTGDVKHIVEHHLVKGMSCALRLVVTDDVAGEGAKVFVCDYVMKSILCTVGRCWSHERSGYWCSLKGSGLCATQKVGVRNRSTFCTCESNVAWLWSASASFLPSLLVFDRTT